jgi:hypothetical protein
LLVQKERNRRLERVKTSKMVEKLLKGETRITRHLAVLYSGSLRQPKL